VTNPQWFGRVHLSFLIFQHGCRPSKTTPLPLLSFPCRKIPAIFPPRNHIILKIARNALKTNRFRAISEKMAFFSCFHAPTFAAWNRNGIYFQPKVSTGTATV
jgi:hypothetical protein